MTKETKMEKKFDKSQIDAINCTKNSVVSAGAGSGKTTVLSERFLNLIKNHDCSVDQILTLTFTKKATVEMSDRIYKVLKKSAPEQAANFYKANIKTIDSYCASIARLGSNHYGISPDFSQDDDKIKLFAKNKALSLILENRNSTVIQATSKSDYEKLAEELFLNPVLGNSTVLSKLDFQKMKEAQINELINFWDENTERISEIFIEIQNEINVYENENPKKTSGATFLKIKTALSKIKEKIPCALTKEKIENQDLEEISSYTAFVTAIKNLALPGNTKGLEVYREKVVEVRELYEKFIQLEQYIKYFDAIKSYFSIAENFQNEINDFKHTSGILTFSDIADIALKTLIDFPEIRKLEKEKYKFIMIDEFQDNNLNQKNLLYLLAENPTRMEKSIPQTSELCTEKLFFVGDEKQSIYKFRGADVSVFRKLSAEFSEGNLSMQTNYRSHPALISMFNTFFGGLSYPLTNDKQNDPNAPSIFYTQKDSDIPDFEAVYNEVTFPETVQKSITSENISSIFTPHTHFALYEQSEDVKNDSKYLNENETEAEWIAEKIEELLRDEEKAITPNDIAILLRSTPNQFYFEKALLKHGIPYVSSAVTGLFSDGVINDIFAFLRICVYENDNLSYAQVLTSPFVNLSVDEANKILLESPIPFAAEGNFLSGESLNRFKKAKSFFSQMKEFCKGEAISKIVSKLWYETGYYFETIWNESVSMYNVHYDLIFSLALKAEQKQQSLASFIDEIFKYRNESNRIKDLDVTSEESKGVQIMTVHKSKGLEFKVVFVADTEKGSQNDRELVYYDKDFGLSLSTKNSPDEKNATTNYFYSLSEDLNNQKNLAELKRLVYVALTRAKNELFITNCKYKPPKENKKEDSVPKTYFKILQPVFEYYKNLKEENPNILIPFDYQMIETKKRDFSISSTKRKNNSTAKKELFQTIEENGFYENAKIYQTENVPSPYTTATSLHKKDDEILTNGHFPILKDVPFSEINQIIEESIPKITDESLVNENQQDEEIEPAFSFTNFGTIAHAYMQSFILGGKPEDYYSLKEFIGLENKAKKIEIVKNACAQMKKSFSESELGKEAKNAKNKYSEFAFRQKLGSKIVKGVIDLIFENQDGTFTIVDYKTNQSVKPELYFEQLACYKNAVSTIFNVPEQKIKCILYYLRFAKSCDITENCKNINLTIAE